MEWDGALCLHRERMVLPPPAHQPPSQQAYAFLTPRGFLDSFHDILEPSSSRKALLTQEQRPQAKVRGCRRSRLSGFGRNQVDGSIVHAPWQLRTSWRSNREAGDALTQLALGVPSAARFASVYRSKRLHRVFPSFCCFLMPSRAQFSTVYGLPAQACSLGAKASDRLYSSTSRPSRRKHVGYHRQLAVMPTIT